MEDAKKDYIIFAALYNEGSSVDRLGECYDSITEKCIRDDSYLWSFQEAMLRARPEDAAAIADGFQLVFESRQSAHSSPGYTAGTSQDQNPSSRSAKMFSNRHLADVNTVLRILALNMRIAASSRTWDSNGMLNLELRDHSLLLPSINSRTAGSLNNGSETLNIDGSQLSPSVNSRTARTAGSSSNGSVTLDIHGALNLEPGDGSQLSPSVNSWTAGSSTNGSVKLDIHGALNLEPGDGSPGQMDPVPELPGNDDQARYEQDLESQMYIRKPSFPAGQTDAGPVSVEQSVPESPGNDDHILFGIKTRGVLASLNARALMELRSSGSSDAIPMNRLVLAALYGIGCFSSAAALLLQIRRPRHAKVLTQVSAVSTGCGILIALSAQFDSEQYSFVNAVVTALLCFMWAVAVIIAG